jgi:hypothetical protein
MARYTAERQEDLLHVLRNVGAGDSCVPWPWERTQSVGKLDYGRVWVDGRRVPAHRWVYEQLVGAIPEGRQIAHRCDNPICVRPDHLFVATPKENMHDASVKGRMRGNRTNHVSGEAHYNHKLTDKEVAQIRRSYLTGQTTTRDLALLFTVNQATIWRILQGKGRFAPAPDEAIALKEALVRRAALGRGPDKTKRHRRWYRKPE